MISKHHHVNSSETIIVTGQGSVLIRLQNWFCLLVRARLLSWWFQTALVVSLSVRSYVKYTHTWQFPLAQGPMSVALIYTKWPSFEVIRQLSLLDLMDDRLHTWCFSLSLWHSTNKVHWKVSRGFVYLHFFKTLSLWFECSQPKESYTIILEEMNYLSDSKLYSGVELRPWTFQWDLTLQLLIWTVSHINRSLHQWPLLPLFL